MAYNSASLYGTLEPREKEYGTGLDPVQLDDPGRAPASVEADAAKQPTGYSPMAQGAVSAMNAGGTAGSALTSAGMMGLMSEGGTAAAAAGPYALAGGLALSAYEQQQKADAMNEQARVQEAQQRKAATQNALNNMLAVTSKLGV